MHDSILDDIKVLLLKEVGEKRILEQIQRAAQNNEVISIHERDYVQNLAEKYLRPKPPEPEKKPKTPRIIEKPISKPESTLTFESKQKESKNSKLFLGIGGAAFTAIIIAIVLSGISDVPATTPELPKTPTPSSVITIVTDVSSYKKGDIISISGKSNPTLGSEVILSIENSDGQIIWTENVKIKSSGKYSTLAIAGGSGWTTAGEFTLIAEHGSERQVQKFTFGS